MAKKKSDEEKRQDADAKASAKFFEQEKANYKKRMTLAAEINAANSDEVVETETPDDSDDNADLENENDDQQSSDVKLGENGDETDAENSSEKN